MKFLVTTVRYRDDVTVESSDVALTVDVTATVGEVARGLVRAGIGHPRLQPLATHRLAQLTLRVTYPDGSRLVLDAGDAIGSSGLQSGCSVEPQLEATELDGVPRAKAAAARLTVLTGPQEGAQFLIVTGETTVGRDRSNRIELHDGSVSRRHAIIRPVTGALEITDLGSANGTRRHEESGNRRARVDRTLRLTRTTVVHFGSVTTRIDIGPPPGSDPELHSTLLHLQAPRVDPVFTPDALELPAPPEPNEPGRFPFVAMAAPLLMGGVLYLTTQSVLSLIFIGLSPVIMIGSWLDSRLTRRRSARAMRDQFDVDMRHAVADLTENSTREQIARSRETPTTAQLATSAERRERDLWARRPEHRAFLEVRLGSATLPSRKTVVLPARGRIPADEWKELTTVSDRFGSIPDVPVLERFDRCGSLGVAGDPFWATAVARALLVQLLSQHSPAGLVLTAFADAARAERDWSWLKWVPHVDSAYSPLRSPHLAADERGSAVLLTSLEGLIIERKTYVTAREVRSRIEGNAAEANERLSPVSGHPVTPAVIVFVSSACVADRTRLVGLAEDGPDVGVHVIWLAEHLSLVPAACRTVIEASSEAWRAHFVREGDIIDLTSVETLGLPAAERFGRALAPIVDAGARVLDESDLPRSVALAHVVPADILGSSDAIVQNWVATDSLMTRWTPGHERQPSDLAAIVGQGSTSPVEIDLRTHGPHALVGGTTGSGKSEFLQAWIFSLAANYAPDRITFLLVDYKGGAAFADCVDLPHTVGLVTDLNTHLVRRALTSFRAELRYREELLAEKGAKDLIALERRGDPDTPPTLVVVIDEFAALVSEIPEFVDGVIDVAQRGRSLGLHLIMATQRPAGVITDNLRANTNLRIALRMADHADSRDVLGSSDAAEFSPETPGRAVVKVGAGTPTHFQSGYLGGRSESDRREPLDVRNLGFGDHAPWALIPEVKRTSTQRAKAPRDIAVLSTNIRLAAAAVDAAIPRKPWVDQLPGVLPLTELDKHVSAGATSDASCSIPIGRRDEPHLQRHSTYSVPLSDVGNVAIFGGAGTGKTTALITVACQAMSREPGTVVYGIDGAGGRLTALNTVPSTGDIVLLEDRDRVLRLLRLVKDIIADRAGSTRGAPPLLFLLDGFGAFRDAYEHTAGGADPLGDLVKIAQRGRGVGVHLLLTSERSVGMPMALAAAVPERLVLRLPAEADYDLVGVPKGVLEECSPGRALRVGTEEEIQLAVPGVGAEPSDTDDAIRALADAQERRGRARPVGVPPVPQRLHRVDIPRPVDGGASFAIDTIHLDPVPAPANGLVLVTGPAGSGRSTAIRSLLDAFTEDGVRTGQTLDCVLISPRRSEIRDLQVWNEVADSSSARDSALTRLTTALGGQCVESAGLPFLPLGGSEPPAPTEDVPTPPAFPAAGRRGIVVIEDIGGFDGSGLERRLAALLKLLRRSNITTIVEGENATLGSVWELASPLRGARWALALQPDANDQPSIFTAPFAHARRADVPPGRGLLVRGATQTGVHVGLP